MRTSLFNCCFMLEILSCISLVTGDVGKCSSGVQYCHYSPWFSWESCNVTSSGENKQIRERTFCCKDAVGCFEKCNITNYVYQEEKICIDESTNSSTGMIVGVCFGILVAILIAVIVTLVLLHRFKKISLFTRLRAIWHKDDDTKTETEPELKTDIS